MMSEAVRELAVRARNAVLVGNVEAYRAAVVELDRLVGNTDQVGRVVWPVEVWPVLVAAGFSASHIRHPNFKG